MVLIHLPSGLRYRVLHPPQWNAPGPSRGDTVQIWCEGWIDDGASCDTCISPADMHTFQLTNDHVIRGLDNAVLTMRVGESRRLYIPADLAYGERGDGSCVPPHSDVIFDVKLCYIESYQYGSATDISETTT